MSIPMRDHVDYGLNEIRNARIQGLTADPTDGSQARIWYRTDLDAFFYFDKTGVRQQIRTMALITSNDIQDGTIVDGDVAAANKDGNAATPSMRTLGTGAQQAMRGDTRLDTIAAPTTPVGLNGQRATGAADPTAPQDLTTKAYVDASIQGLDAKASVKVASTGNLGLTGLASVDGTNIADGDFVLVKNQNSAPDNGIYVAHAGAWTRRSDMDSWSEVPGAFVFVEQGNSNSETGWVCTSDTGGTLGSTGINWTQFSAAGSYTAGNGIVLTGNVFSAKAGDGISVTAAGIAVVLDAAGALETNGGAIRVKLDGSTLARTANGLKVIASPKKWASFGDGATTSFTFQHNLNDTRVVVQVKDTSTGAIVFATTSIVDANNVTVGFGSAPAANAYEVLVMA